MAGVQRTDRRARHAEGGVDALLAQHPRGSFDGSDFRHGHSPAVPEPALTPPPIMPP